MKIFIYSMILTLVLFYFSSDHELTRQLDELDYVY
jgi:hypothetical protein